MKNIKKQIVLLGGMGPDASIDLYKKIIQCSAQLYGAEHNEDFPYIVLYSVPVPDFISNEENRNISLAMLKDVLASVDDLSSAHLAIACNTAHLLADELQLPSITNFISMINAVVAEATQQNITKIGLVGSPTTIRQKIYETPLQAANIECIVPSDDEIVRIESIIRSILKGQLLQDDRNFLNQVVGNLRNQGAQAVILGCTELPLLFPQDAEAPIPIIKSTDILAKELARAYYTN